MKTQKPKPKYYHGTCQHCRTKITEVHESQTRVITDRDSPQGARCCTCPECRNEYVCLKQSKY